ncbi:DUF4190 domain-containing protein [Austwickia sp. TVS 96-490-7B]|uniref:DUF4190 domain-containing protein n=1 Tax=Austwickia sp. TVS 96-490-7B TaxID=2830843 RepID=UPI001C582D1E|nr:DUF4190 domain-containing protein [Austwickia sp. TVS 96-490-7B]
MSPKNGLGTAALVLGILSLIGSLIPLLGILVLPFALVGLILGIIGLSRVTQRVATNRGSALAGIILNILSMVLAVTITAITGNFIWQAQKSIPPPPQATHQPWGTPTSSAKIRESQKHKLLDSEGQLTILEVADDVNAESEIQPIQPEMKYVAIKMNIENIGEKNYTRAPWLIAYLTSDSGKRYTPSYNPYRDGQAMPLKTDIPPGESVSGWVMFSIPREQKAQSIEVAGISWSLH